MMFKEKSHTERLSGAMDETLRDTEAILDSLEGLVSKRDAVASGIMRIDEDEAKKLSGDIDTFYEKSARALEYKLKSDGLNAFSSRDAFLLITIIKRALRAKARKRGGLEPELAKNGIRMLSVYKDRVKDKHLQFNDYEEGQELLGRYGLIGEDRPLREEDLLKESFEQGREEAA